MTEQATEVKTDREIADEIIQLIDGTHWTKKVLACVNIIWDRYANGKLKYRTRTIRRGGHFNYELGKHEDLIIRSKVPKVDPETNMVITKPTACLVGLVLRVQGKEWMAPDDKLDINWVNSWLEETYESSSGEPHESDLKLSVPEDFMEVYLDHQAKRIIKKLAWHLYDRLSERQRDNTFGKFYVRQEKIESMNPQMAIAAVELWNDDGNTTREDVRSLVVTMRDAEPAPDNE